MSTIKAIRVYQVDLPLREGDYRWSGGKSVSVFDSTVVEIETNTGELGYGEVCPLGPAYLPAYADGVRTGIRNLAPHLIGMEATQMLPLNERMDAVLKGHPYVKSAIDMACWDLFGKACNQSVCELLGGRFGKGFVLYRAISQQPAMQMADNVRSYRDQGYRRFQLKVGGDPLEDIERIRAVSKILQPGDRLVADANTGWAMHDGIRVVRAVKDVDVYIEQPCSTYEQCLQVKDATDHPFVLDECIDSMESIVRAFGDRAAQVINIKISKFGGLTRARLARDLCASLGISMTIEDSWGGDIVTSAIAALAHSTPIDLLFSSTDFNSYVDVSIAKGAPQREAGRLSASVQPGLGICPRMDVLQSPVFECTQPA